ncbi:UDP-N-acetylmuramoyl-tripeptide--D-alanyl-D-alanine ligase [Pseudoramibacter alactolyticus ATCC 23263]|uniref:UDP-N-acetylmuramoyl-tripeptide--D-alanyl-D-alanine ligase n=1 Tax=Pseudoramibacter alactolyticus ATCC 23263 TaxID=887929 RepID=E6MGD0_9FIRM|nr:UDP-N-acetylmuramoyl-tripeptide--D-alanyl-D-alanine ligase [Pseudoramibacter alactolyticus]EFV01670.1 UDP-N-acetylmuramoyl-tripeptide--D-alanyl-D-alanine ligase [Pseudoramibacter alactolyticus ATCC 23263]
MVKTTNQKKTNEMAFEPWSVEAVAAITQGKVVHPGAAIHGIATDSRQVKPRDLYIPIIGARNDGHDFIDAACANGAAAVLCDSDHLPAWQGKIDAGIVGVADTFEAMRALAAANRARYDIPVVAVTGSAGKTTTKDLIASVLSMGYQTMKTQGNFNNEVGVPLTLFQLTPAHEAAVVEMGMNHPGEIARSIGEVRPHIGVITNIGSAHLENLGSKENTLKAKMEIFGTMEKDDIALINGDDPYLRRIVARDYRVVRVGIREPDADLKAEAIREDLSGLYFEADGVPFHFKWPGIHNVYNCLIAIWIGRYYHLDDAAIQAGLDAFVPSGNRMQMAEVGGLRFVNDAYNANPESMRAAMDTVCAVAEGRKIAVLGDMLEIGENAEAWHRAVGEYAGTHMDVLIGVGEWAETLCEGARGAAPNHPAVAAATVDAAAQILGEIAQTGDTVLIKASHSLALDRIIDRIKTGDRWEKPGEGK